MSSLAACGSIGLRSPTGLKFIQRLPFFRKSHAQLATELDESELTAPCTHCRSLPGVASPLGPGVRTHPDDWTVGKGTQGSNAPVQSLLQCLA